MKIEMIADLIGRETARRIGDIIDTDNDADAVRLIQAGYAKAVIEPDPDQTATDQPAPAPIIKPAKALPAETVTGE